MTSEGLYALLGEIREEYVAEAETPRRRRAVRKWLALAACLCLAAALAIPFLTRPATEPKSSTPADAEGPPSFTVEGRTYIVSPHLAVSDTLPEGFTAAGTVDVAGGFENCPYYQNPDVPEWIYVYQEVRTDGTVDETGTLTATPPHNAYARYVDARLRGRNLICFDGAYYISMWTVRVGGDITEEAHDAADARYGNRIEGEAPAGFVRAGTAEFTGDDTVPTGTLASNAAAADVYYSRSDPDVLLLQTHWFTAPDETGETRHDGFDVYIRYNCPFAPEE